MNKNRILHEFDNLSYASCVTTSIGLTAWSFVSSLIRLRADNARKLWYGSGDDVC